jgi:major outer membrane protein
MHNGSKYLIFVVLIAHIVGIQAKDRNNKCSDADNVFVDSPFYALDTQFRALFLQPSTNNLYYAAEAFPFNNAIATPLASPRWQIFDLHPDYHFGFDLGLCGVFHSRNSNFAINWEHFKSCTAAAYTVDVSANDMIGPLSSIGPDAALYTRAQGKVTFNFNEVNIHYGQYVNLGLCTQLNVYAGISIAQIKQHLSTIYSGAGSGTGTISRTTFVPSSFMGAGPQAGLDFAYTIARGFNIAGKFTAALLVGTAKNHTAFASTSPVLVALGDPSPNLQRTCVENRVQMIPSFGERLGLAYFCSFCENYMAKIEVGYEAKIFLNAIQSTDISSGVINLKPFGATAGVFARTFARTLGNFSLGGPYIAFNMAF